MTQLVSLQREQWWKISTYSKNTKGLGEARLHGFTEDPPQIQDIHIVSGGFSTLHKEVHYCRFGTCQTHLEVVSLFFVRVFVFIIKRCLLSLG